MSTFVIKQNDLLPRLDFTLLDDTTPVDLTNAVSVRFIMRNLFTGIKVNRAVIVLNQSVSANHGKCYLTWAAGDTETAGSFKAEIEVLWPPDDTPQTFPGNGYFTVKVIKELDDPAFSGTAAATASATLTASGIAS